VDRDTLIRTGRTFLQLGVAEAFIKVLEAFGVPLTTDQHVALLGLITVLVTFALNALENSTGNTQLK
jgi:ABC-type Co2+ transport system permease subunit